MKLKYAWFLLFVMQKKNPPPKNKHNPPPKKKTQIKPEVTSAHIGESTRKGQGVYQLRLEPVPS